MMKNPWISVLENQKYFAFSLVFPRIEDRSTPLEEVTTLEDVVISDVDSRGSYAIFDASFQGSAIADIYNTVKSLPEDERKVFAKDLTMLYYFMQDKYLAEAEDYLRSTFKANLLGLARKYILPTDLFSEHTYLFPIFLSNEGHLFYLVYGVTPKSEKLFKVTSYIGVGERGIKLPEVIIERTYFKLMLANIYYSPGKMRILTPSTVYAGIGVLSALRAIMGEFPANLLRCDTSSVFKGSLQLIVKSLKSMKLYNLLKLLTSLRNFSDYVDTLLPDELAEKVKLGKELSPDEEILLAKFLDLAANLLQAKIAKQRFEVEFAIRFLNETDFIPLGFLYCITGKYPIPAIKLPKAVSKDYVRDSGLKIKYFNGNIFAIHQNSVTILGVTLNGVDLKPVKEEVKGLFYALDRLEEMEYNFQTGG